MTDTEPDRLVQPVHVPYAVWTWDQPYVACDCGWGAVIYDGSDVSGGVDWGHDNTVTWTAHIATQPACRCVTRNGEREATFGCPVHPAYAEDKP